MNASTPVFVHKPFVVTRSMIITYIISNRLLSSDHLRNGVVIRCDKKSMSREKVLRSKEFSRRSIAQLEMNLLQGLDLEGFDETTDYEFNHFNCHRDMLNISENRLTFLGPNLSSLFKKLVELDISHNELTCLNEPLLRDCVNLQTLKMLKSCRPDARFSLSFISSLRKLQTLELTLPPVPFDLSSLQHLSHLVLESVSSVDANHKRSTFTNESFKQLSRKLFSLSLSYFEIDCIDEEALAGLDRLRELNLTNNGIARVNLPASISFPTRRLDLSNNQIDQVKESSLAGLQDLSTLNLEMNVISQLNKDCFRGLDKLSKLVLSHNRLDRVHSEAFSSLVSLAHLDLSFNSIQQIAGGDFPRMERLTELILDDNPIKKIKPNAFGNLSLSRLYLKNCQLRSIDNQMFHGIKWLHSLHLDGNQISSFNVITADSIQIINRIMSTATIETVRKHLFSGWHGLRVLSLKGNRLEKLDLNVFCNLTELQDLDLSSNRINELNAVNMAKNLFNLTSLSLGSNQLRFIDKNAFSGLRALKNLNLSNNKLEALESSFFEFSRVLKCVHLNGNKLTMNIDANTFPGSFELINEIYLQENPSVSIKDDAFSGMKGLNRLSLDLTASFVGLPDQTESVSSSYSSFDYFEHCGLEPDYEMPFTHLRLQKSDQQTLERFLQSPDNQKSFAKITQLAMPSCSIRSLDKWQLAMRFPCLLKLDLSRNLFEALEPQWFDNMPKLWELNLAGNNLTDLDNPDVFRGLPNLTSINLSENKLKHLHPQVFHARSQLEVLNLSKNAQLSDISDDLFRGLYKLKEIHLDGNGISRLNLARILKTCKQVEVLNLSNNQLDQQTINKETMSLGSHLKEVGLASNRLSSCEFIERLAKLEKLDLSANQIETLTLEGRNLFGRLMSLQRLNLRGNRIKSIDKSIFAHLSPVVFKLTN